MRLLGLLAAALLAFAGVWAVTHPDAWYPGARGIGWELTPGMRRVFGWFAIATSAAFLYFVVPHVGAPGIP